MAWVEDMGGRFRVRAYGPDGRVVTVAWCQAREDAVAFAAKVPRATPDRVARRERRALRLRERGYAVGPLIRPGSDPRLEAWVAAWRTGLRVNAATRARYECLLGVHILPRFGWMRLSAISRAEIRAWSVKLSATYAPSTVASILALLSGILGEAVRGGLMPVNPAGQMALPRPRRAEWEVPDPAAIAVLAGVLDEGPALLVLLGAYTGMRWGELVGLHRSNVHLTGTGPGFVPFIRVDAERGALHEVGGQIWLGPPKTHAAGRDVHLPVFLAERLAAHLGGHPYPFVFCGPRGGWLRRSNFQRRTWAPALATAREHGCALPYVMTFHRLRHVHKSWMAEDRTPASLQDHRLGHAPHGVQGTYEHPTPAMVARLIADLERRWCSTVADSASIA